MLKWCSTPVQIRNMLFHETVLHLSKNKSSFVVLKVDFQADESPDQEKPQAFAANALLH